MNLPKQFLLNMQNILKDEYEDFISSYNFAPKKALRINTLKNITKEQLPFELFDVPWCKEGYYYANCAPGKHVFHEMGLYYIQEPSAMAVVEELDIQKGDMVLDLCAAPGGKSTQIACKLQGSGYLISNEIILKRAKILAQNVERLGLKNVTVLNESPKNLVKKFKNTFNKILVDAPCSGEGMFRKLEEAVSEWSEENVHMCAKRQLEILESAKDMLRSDGTIVFSTCTFSSVENEGVVKTFLDNNKDFKLVSTKNKFSNGINGLIDAQRLYPHKIAGEGHFIAVLKRVGEQNSQLNLKNKVIKQDKIFTRFVKENLNIEIEYNNRLKDKLYISGPFNLDELKVESFGLYLGEIKKDRFEPSHALALALKKEHFKKTINLSVDDENVQKYVKGETFDVNHKGWAVVCVNNNPLGWVKCDGVIAKNHYPKYLRKEL